MDNKKDKIWYRESTMIACTMEDINQSLSDLGKHYLELMSLYPGMTTVELPEPQDALRSNLVTIKTNEGTMKRTNIAIVKAENKIRIELDEEYITSKVTTNSYIVEQFEAISGGVELQITISNLSAPGFLGFFLRNFGSKNIGNGFLDAYRKLFQLSD